MKGKFITFEGCEGVGKSTQIRLLKEELQAAGKDAVFTREPGGSSVAEKIRNMILDAENAEMCDKTEALLYAAARAQHIADILAPNLAAGRLVVCDRYIDSTFAYQGVARGLGEAYTDSLNRLAAGEYFPDLTVFLDLPPEEAFARKGGRDKADRLENMDLAFHKRVYEGYLKIAERAPERFVRVDASGSKAETHRKVLAVLSERGIL